MALTRSTPIRPGTPMRRSRLRKVSRKRAKLAGARRKCLAVVRERSGGRCECRCSPDCTGHMDTGHEPLKRSRGGDPTDPAQVLAACNFCNAWIEENPAEATRLGLSISRYEGRRNMDTTAIEVSVVQLGEATPTEKLLEAGYQIARLKEFVREVDTMWQAKMVERIQATGPIKDGDNLYRVGAPPKTSCNNVPAAVEALLIGVGGDFNVFCEHLSSGALKYGAFKATLGADVFAQHFTVVREPELQVDEATPRRLQKLNLAFSR